jgi:hypothetical protein
MIIDPMLNLQTFISNGINSYQIISGSLSKVRFNMYSVCVILPLPEIQDEMDVNNYVRKY